MEFSVLEFKGWDDECSAKLGELLTQLKVWKAGENIVPTMHLAEFQVRSGEPDHVLAMIGQWMINAKAQCSTIMQLPHSGYIKLIFVITWNHKQIDLAPMLEQNNPELGRFSLANATVIKLGKQNFSLYSTNEEGWQSWLQQEEHFSSTPIEELITNRELEEISNEQGSFSTEDKPGQAFYQKKS